MQNIKQKNDKISIPIITANDGLSRLRPNAL
jgi:hypothetical protein